MKIKILKTGKFSLHPAWGPAVNVTEDQELSLPQFEKVCSKYETEPKKAMLSLIEAGWAKPIDFKIGEENSIMYEPNSEIEDSDEDEDEEPGEVDDITDVASHLEKLIEGKDADESKQIIQDWGMVNCNHKVTKVKNPENMIQELVEVYAEMNPE